MVRITHGPHGPDMDHYPDLGFRVTIQVGQFHLFPLAGVCAELELCSHLVI